jgi:Iron-sulfur cluster binding domain of dihydroorotate dehydrogenase B
VRTYPARVAEIQLYLGGAATRSVAHAAQIRSARIACSAAAVPHPGQVLLAVDRENVLGASLFFAGDSPDGFLCAPPIPVSWEPGTELTLYGPLGRGFQIPTRSGSAFRLALVAAGDSAARLLPLASRLPDIASVALFGDAPFPALPAFIEAYPLDDLRESFGWADFLAIDVPVEELEDLLNRLVDGLAGAAAPPGQILIYATMPCAGFGECGVCGVKTRRGSWQLACKDGPVFDLRELCPSTI